MFSGLRKGLSPTVFQIGHFADGFTRLITFSAQ